MGATPAVRAFGSENADSRLSFRSRPHARSPDRTAEADDRVRATPGANGEKLASNYELFNRNNLSIRFRSWNYRGCWHQTCPPIDTRTTRARTIRIATSGATSVF